MFLKLFFVLILLSSSYAKEYINLGKFENDNSIFQEKNIPKLSDKFLDTKYISNTLSNGQINTSKENLIINFDALDCFTFIDTFEALKQSDNIHSFKKHLIDIRYKNSIVSYHNRNHFFSDWRQYNFIKDITCDLGECKKELKQLNFNEKYLKEIPTILREISYIKSTNIDTTKLQNGDYIGIYSNKKDLDVTHTGLIIKKDNQIFIRHASSLKKKIIDSDLFEYTKNKPGVIIYRSNHNLSKLHIDATCSKSLGKEFHITIENNKLFLTDDALYETVGGYVDIPATNYYFKIDNKIYPIDGVVEYSNIKSINQFSSFIDEKNFNALQNSQTIQFIQKIKLKENQTSTISISVDIDNKSFTKVSQECQEQLHNTKDKYNKNISIALVILILLILSIKSYKRYKSNL